LSFIRKVTVDLRSVDPFERAKRRFRPDNGKPAGAKLLLRQNIGSNICAVNRFMLPFEAAVVGVAHNSYLAMFDEQLSIYAVNTFKETARLHPTD
jgi:hypothetical protein